jgi:MFS family permease
VNASRRAWTVWALAVTAYCIAVFHRASLGVAGIQAQQRFGATAAVLSLFVVLQLAVYAGLQVPVGVLLDRLGSRRMIAAGAAIMGAGQLVLAESHSVGLAVLARVLVGTGDAMTFTSVLRLIAVWFPARRVPLMTQLTAMLGQAGQIAAAYPLVALLSGAGWSASFLAAGFAGVAVAVAVFAFLRDAPPWTPLPEAPATLSEARRLLGHAWREPGTRLGLWTHFVTQFSGTVFALLWGYPFIVQGEGRTPAEAGLLLTVLVVVAIPVGPALGQLVGRWPFRRSVPTLAIVGATATAWAVVLAWPGRAPFALLVLLVVVLATNGPGSMVGFDYARTENPPTRLGSATGIVNVGGFVASLSTMLLVGLVLDLRAGGTGATAHYTLGDFRVALAVQYVVWAVGLTGVLLTRRRLRALRAPELEPLPRAVARAARERRQRRRESAALEAVVGVALAAELREAAADDVRGRDDRDVAPRLGGAEPVGDQRGDQDRDHDDGQRRELRGPERPARPAGAARARGPGGAHAHRALPRDDPLFAAHAISSWSTSTCSMRRSVSISRRSTTLPLAMRTRSTGTTRVCTIGSSAWRTNSSASSWRRASPLPGAAGSSSSIGSRSTTSSSRRSSTVIVTGSTTMTLRSRTRSTGTRVVSTLRRSALATTSVASVGSGAALPGAAGRGGAGAGGGAGGGTPGRAAGTWVVGSSPGADTAGPGASGRRSPKWSSTRCLP